MLTAFRQVQYLGSLFTLYYLEEESPIEADPAGMYQGGMVGAEKFTSESDMFTQVRLRGKWGVMLDAICLVERVVELSRKWSRAGQCKRVLPCTRGKTVLLGWMVVPTSVASGAYCPHVEMCVSSTQFSPHERQENGRDVIKKTWSVYGANQSGWMARD